MAVGPGGGDPARTPRIVAVVAAVALIVGAGVGYGAGRARGLATGRALGRDAAESDAKAAACDRVAKALAGSRDLVGARIETRAACGGSYDVGAGSEDTVACSTLSRAFDDVRTLPQATGHVRELCGAAFGH